MQGHVFIRCACICIWNRRTNLLLLDTSVVTMRKAAAQPRRRRPVVPVAGQRAPDACLPPMQEPTNLHVCLLFSHVRLPAHGNTGSSQVPGSDESFPALVLASRHGGCRSRSFNSPDATLQDVVQSPPRATGRFALGERPGHASLGSHGGLAPAGIATAARLDPGALRRNRVYRRRHGCQGRAEHLPQRRHAYASAPRE